MEFRQEHEVAKKEMKNKDFKWGDAINQRKGK